VALPVFVRLLFGIPIIFGILFATIVAGTSPEITLSLLGGAKSKAIEILKFESLVNTPLTVLFPFLVMDIASKVETTILSQFIDQIGPFLAKFVAGIGSGVLIGIILFRALRRVRSRVYSPLSIIIGALLSYVLAENVGGNGVLAVTTLGLFVGNLYKKEKVEEMLSFETILATSLYILVFILIGFMIRIPFTVNFLWRASVLLGVYFVVRYISLAVMFPRKSKEFKFKEKVFMTLNIPKGIAVAVVVFTLSTFAELTPHLKSVLDLVLFFMVCSIIFSTVTMFFSKKLIGEEVAPVK
jgi:NhaP-type Na+/H+ or K+/H+ antiporter